jgi:hypothetical protein
MSAWICTKMRELTLYTERDNMPRLSISQRLEAVGTHRRGSCRL